MTAVVTETKKRRAARLQAFREVQAIVARYHKLKLQENEAEIIEQAAEDLLLASHADGDDVVAAVVAFNTLMDNLEAGRWADMVGTDKQPGSALRLRRAFAACAPVNS